MSAMMGGTHYHTPQTIFQHMMGGQPHPNPDSPQWMQIPQVPAMSMPWAVPSSPSVIKFGEDRPQTSFGVGLHQKRKLDPSDMIEPRQHKQFITEEKMAAHFQDLHISTKSSTGPEPVPSTSTAFELVESANSKIDLSGDLDMEGPTIVELETEQQPSGPRLIMSEELKRLQSLREPSLPSSLLSKLERPSMALVLWEPPNKHLRLLAGAGNPPNLNRNADDEVNNNNNATASNDRNIADNNNEEIADMNEMITDVEDSTLKPMDL